MPFGSVNEPLFAISVLLNETKYAVYCCWIASCGICLPSQSNIMPFESFDVPFFAVAVLLGAVVCYYRATICRLEAL